MAGNLLFKNQSVAYARARELPFLEDPRSHINKRTQTPSAGIICHRKKWYTSKEPCQVPKEKSQNAVQEHSSPPRSSSNEQHLPASIAWFRVLGGVGITLQQYHHVIHRRNPYTCSQCDVYTLGVLLLLLRGMRCSYRRTSSLLSQSHPLLSTAPKHTRTFIFLDSQVQVVGTSLRAPVPPFPVGRGIHSCAGAGVDSVLSEGDARARSAPLFPKGTPHSTDCYLLLLRFIDTIEPFPAFLSAF